MPTGFQDESAAVAILGRGVIGLTTAVSLLERGIPCTLFAPPREPASAGIASAAAPAVFTPFTGADSVRLERWIHASFARYRDLAALHPDASGVRMTEFREYLYKAPRHTPLAHLLSERPITPRPPGLVAASASLRPHILTARFLPWLEHRLLALGGSIIPQHITDPAALLAPQGAASGFRIIINCTGIGAHALTADARLRPIAGQVLHIPNTIGLTYSLHDDAPNDRVAYIFTYDDRLVLGSTNLEGHWTAEASADAELAIIERCRTLLKLDGHPRWNDLARDLDRPGSVIARLAGLRPARGNPGISEDPRVEAQQIAPGRWIYHHYGHGRSGVTLAWGTAAEVADGVAALLAS